MRKWKISESVEIWLYLHTFSAFWLRSSVVSVLLSLISEIWDIIPNRLIRKIYAAIWSKDGGISTFLYLWLAIDSFVSINVTSVLQYLWELRAKWKLFTTFKYEMNRWQLKRHWFGYKCKYCHLLIINEISLSSVSNN